MRSAGRRITLVPRRLLIAGALVLCVAAAAVAQRRFDGGFGGGYGRVPPIHNAPYDGQFTFVRVKYDTAPGGDWAGGRPSWVHQAKMPDTYRGPHQGADAGDRAPAPREARR